MQQPDNAPCVFLKSPEEIQKSEELGIAHRARTTREINGYPRELQLNDALKILNEELKCYSFWATLPPLTEDEIVAAVVGGPDYGGETAWRTQREALARVATTRTMPKGSLLLAEGGGCALGALPDGRQRCSKGLKIYLILALDKNPRASTHLNPDQVFLIRKTMFTTELR